MGFDDLAKRQTRKSPTKTIALALIVGAIALFGVLEWQRRSIKPAPVDPVAENRRAAETLSRSRRDADRALAAYFESKIRPVLGTASGEPTVIPRPILPIEPRHGDGNEKVDTRLDAEVYTAFSPEERTDRPEAAASIAVIERSYDAAYGNVAVVSTRADVSIYDVKTARLIGKLTVSPTAPAPAEATLAQVDEYEDRFAGTIAAYLRAVPAQK